MNIITTIRESIASDAEQSRRVTEPIFTDFIESLPKEGRLRSLPALTLYDIVKKTLQASCQLKQEVIISMSIESNLCSVRGFLTDVEGSC